MRNLGFFLGFVFLMVENGTVEEKEAEVIKETQNSGQEGLCCHVSYSCRACGWPGPFTWWAR